MLKSKRKDNGQKRNSIKAAYDFLKKCNDEQYVRDDKIAVYYSRCLINDIAHELGIEEN